MISNWLRCSGVASERRYDQASGTLTVRPSARFVVIASSVTWIAMIRGSLLATVLLPCLYNTFKIVENGPSDLVEFLCRKPVVSAQSNRVQPELADLSVPSHMHMLRFVAVETVKEEPVCSRYARNRRHRSLSNPLQEQDTSHCTRVGLFTPVDSDCVVVPDFSRRPLYHSAIACGFVSPLAVGYD